jgi:tetratricopeptide (TPR) repeat protein
VHCAHRLADRFPDGQLYLNLRGFGPAESVVTPAEAMRHVLDTFAIPPHRVPADLDMQAALYRSLVSGRRMLIVLDNARDADQVRPLLPGSPTCFTIVTSRVALTELVTVESARPMTLAPLPDDGARDLLSRRLGAGRVAAESPAIAEIIRACAGLPLALALVAARAAFQPAFPLTAIANQLTVERSDPAAFGDFGGLGEKNDPAVLFSWSYRALSPGAARLFRLLALGPGPSTDHAAAAHLADLDEDEVRPLLTELSRAHLIAEIQPGRFTFHDLVRSYAAGLAATTDSEVDRRAALYRLLIGYYHGRAVEAVHLFARGQRPATGTGRHYFADRAAAAAWLATQRAALLAAVTLGHVEGFHDLASRLADAIDVYLDMAGWREERAAIQRVAVEATRLAGNSRVRADSVRNLGLAERDVGRPELALHRLRESLQLSRAAGDVRGEARTYRAIANVLSGMGRVDESLRYSEEALALHRDLGGTGLANALNELGYHRAVLGDPATARRYCLEALEALEREVMPERTRAATLDSLGYIEREDGNLNEAAAYYRAAVDLRRDLGERYPQATSLIRLAETVEKAGDSIAAAEARAEALAILEELGHPDADALRGQSET